MLANAFLIGDKVYLKALEVSDLETSNYVSWLNDKIVCSGNSHHLYPFTKDEGLDYIKNLKNNKNELTLGIFLKENGCHIGNISLKNIHSINRSAEFAILIGEKDCWGNNFGYEAAKLIICHGFNELNLNRIYCGTFDSNIGMIKLAKQLNMTQEGTLRESVFKSGKYLNVINFSILREEYL